MSTRTEPCPKCVEQGRDSRGNNLVCWSNNHKHCFACGHHIFPKTYSTPTPKENVPKSLLPTDFTREIPTHAWKWLLQWGLGAAYWKESVGYSPSKQRLIFRVGDTELRDGRLQKCDTPLAFSLGRYLPQENEHPSTLHSTSLPDQVRDQLLRRGWQPSVVRANPPPKWLTYGDPHKHAEVVGQVNQGVPVVLVEDILSGHKVASSGYISIPLFGTRAHTPVLYYLMHCTNPVVLWLDKDQEGNVKREAIRLQALINRPVRVVSTDNDPKALSSSEICEVLK